MYKDIAEIKRANRDRGHYFFEPDTMRFFNSRILPTLYGGRFFVTSECREPHPYTDMSGKLQPATPRRYTVREARDDGSIETISDFNCLSKAQAVRLAKECADIGAGQDLDRSYLRSSVGLLGSRLAEREQT